MNAEVWKTIPGFEDYYEVSDRGRVKSLHRVAHIGRSGSIIRVDRERIMKLCLRPDGYMQAIFCVNGVTTHHLVHKLVLSAFRGPRPTGHQSAHYDGVRRNNALENLRYATNAQNTADKIRHGTLNPNAKLTRNDVLAIRKDKRVARVIAMDYGVSKSAIWHVKDGRSWFSVQEKHQ